MAYQLLEGESIEDAIRRIACEQIEKSAADIDDPDLDLHETVHEFRKRCKKIRGLLRLALPALPGYAEENAWFRDRARELSALRDATSIQECLDSLLDRYSDDIGQDDFSAVGHWLQQRRDDLMAEQNADSCLFAIREELPVARERASDWQLGGLGIEAIATGMTNTYRRARKAMYRAAAKPSARNFHEWRKRVKYYRYQTRLIKPAWPAVFSGLHKEAKRLSELLGDEHDLAVLRDTLGRDAERAGKVTEHTALLALVELRSAELRACSLSLGRRLFAEKPKRHSERLVAILEAWQIDERQSLPFPRTSSRVDS